MSPHSNPNRRRPIIIISCVIILIAVSGVGMRLHASWSLREQTKEDAVPIVVLIKAKQGAATEEVILPGNVQAWHEAPIYARTNGYLKNWKTDIGTRVKAGELLAEIETPEIDSQMRQAAADLETAQANEQLAQSTAKRWKALLKTDSVSKQETDEKISDAQAKMAALASAQANLDRLRDLESFKRVVAPFAGTITARNTDNGALINSGSGTNVGQELFHIADTSKLRVYVQVPQNDVSGITPKMAADLHFDDHPGKVYQAKLIKTADAIDPANRTLMAEFEIDNPSGELLAGGYTEVHMKLVSKSDAVHLPVNTLIFRAEGLQVATVDSDNHVVLKPVTMGRDYGNDVEIKAGLTPEEPVIVNPPDSLGTGDLVRIKQPQDKKEGDAKSKDEKK